MKIILTGGGTAGHVSPAIAIAEEIKQREKHAEILFIGRGGGGENEQITNSGYKLTTIKIHGIQRKLTVKNVRNVFLAIRAVSKAEKIIKEFAPDVIVGTGGYVCWPVLKSGQRLKIPTLLHESNLYPGLVTRLLEKGCDKILLNLPGTLNYLKAPEKSIVVGNPLRKGFESTCRSAAREKLKISSSEVLIVSFGGSIGSEKMNDTIVEVMQAFSSKDRKIKHVHGTGARYYDKYKNHDNQKNGCLIVPYINNMHTYLAAADVAICRCGAITLSELAALSVPSILIPSPNVTDNHQYKNGKYVAEKGAAILIEEKDLSAKILTDKIKSIINNPSAAASLKKKISEFAKPNAAKNTVDLIYDTVKKRN